MKRLPSFSLSSVAIFGVLAALVACGGISDPTRSSEKVATISGALTGTDMPSGTRVALVWKVGQTGNYAVTSDVPVVNGKFTMDLATPPDSYFFSAEGDYDGLSGGGTEGIAKYADASAGKSGQLSFGMNVAPRDTVSGQINQPLSSAVAGFVVYVDT
ncbi:MAG: hypothetical protein K0S65_3461, partial [Labilithrix sp.]|nr:hypothetical protein [Labilithrix sp.]